ncbi:unnamed protein product [Anisakis simplex]|uniref:Uncharacterized protein n=1 Tax=Anisakis simplex TaxID=6269 RepID=A0A0M3J0C0_ANISI|nr:unnamed protein product [Anisakis simplex]
MDDHINHQQPEPAVNPAAAAAAVDDNGDLSMHGTSLIKTHRDDNDSSIRTTTANPAPSTIALSRAVDMGTSSGISSAFVASTTHHSMRPTITAIDEESEEREYDGDEDELERPLLEQEDGLDSGRGGGGLAIGKRLKSSAKKRLVRKKRSMERTPLLAARSQSISTATDGGGEGDSSGGVSQIGRFSASDDEDAARMCEFLWLFYYCF